MPTSLRTGTMMLAILQLWYAGEKAIAQPRTAAASVQQGKSGPNAAGQGRPNATPGAQDSAVPDLAPADPPAKSAGDKSKAPGKGLPAKQEQPSYLVEIHPISSDNAEEISGLLGKPQPFSVKARDTRTVLVYSSKRNLTGADREILHHLISQIDQLALLPSTSQVIDIPNVKTLGDLSARIKALNCSGITLASAGDHKVLITRSNSVTNRQYDACVAALQDIGGGLRADRPVEQLYYITAMDAAAALGAKSGGADKSDKDGSGSNGASTTITVDDKSLQAVGIPCAPGKKNATSSSGTDKKKARDSSDNSGGDNSAPDKSGDDSNCIAIDGGGSGSDSKADSSKPSLSITTLAPDLMIFGNNHPGDDADIVEKKRILAQLDFPRPEVIINTFSFQTSSSRSNLLIEGSRQLQDAVGHYNDNIQHALDRTWRYLDCESTTTDFFDSAFVDYLTLPVIANGFDGDIECKRSPSGCPANHSCTQCNSTPSFSSDAKQKACGEQACPKPPQLTIDENRRRSDKICPADRYCLGYTTLFHPIRLSLTDMLLAVISASDASWEIEQALDVLENKELIEVIRTTEASTEGSRCGRDCRLRELPRNCSERDVYFLRKAAALAQQKTESGRSMLEQIADAAQRRSQANQNKCKVRMPEISRLEFMPLSCFEEEVNSAFPRDSGSDNEAKLLRAALANFLFQYKFSVEYPHDFSPYALRESAQALDSQLNRSLLLSIGISPPHFSHCRTMQT